MDQALASYYLYRSFQIEVGKSDKITLNIRDKGSNEVIKQPILINISLAGLSFTSPTELPIGSELEVSLHMRKWFNRWDLDLKGQVVKCHLNSSQSNHFQYNIYLEDNLELSYFIKDYIHRFSSSKLKSYLINSTLAEKQADISDGVELFSLLILFYEGMIKKEQDSLPKLLKDAAHLLNANLGQIFIINPDTDQLEEKYTTENAPHTPQSLDFRDGDLGSVFNSEHTLNKGISEKATLISPIYNKNRKVIGVIQFKNKIYDKRFTHTDERALRLLSTLFSQFYQDFCPSSKSSQIDKFNPAKRDVNLYIGTSLLAKKTKRFIQNFMTLDENILFIGEEGLGKTFIAEHIHKSSCQAKGDFFVYDCHETSKDFALLLDKIKEDENGSILLKNVNELPLKQQEAVYHHGIHSNKRFFCTSQYNLKKSLNKNFYKFISQVSVHLPPLRSRGKDLLETAYYFLRHECHERGLSKNIDFSEDSKQFIQNHSWKKNIREMELTIKKSLMKNNSPLIEISHPSFPNNQPPSKLEELIKQADRSLSLEEQLKFLKEAA